MNYVYPQQQQQYVRPTYGATTSAVNWNNRVRPVSSIDEVKAASIDFDGSVFFFPDFASNRIYTKQINMDGTASLNMYEMKEIPTAEAPNYNAYVTREEFENVINQLKLALVPAETVSTPNPALQF